MVGAERCKVWRKSRNWNQDQAADFFGVTQAAWSDWESGKKSPRVEQANDLDERSGGAIPVSSWRWTAAELRERMALHHARDARERLRPTG